MALQRTGDRRAGIGNTRTAGTKNIWHQANGQKYAAGNLIVDSTGSFDSTNTGDTRVLSPGTIMGKITTGGLYRPAILATTITSATAASGATALTLANAAQAVALSANAFTNPTTLSCVSAPTGTGTVATLSVTVIAINTTTGVLTVGGIAAAIAGGSILAPTDGSLTPRGVLDEYVNLLDEAAVDTDPPLSRLAISGVLKTGSLVNATSTLLGASVYTWLKGQLSNASQGPEFQFDDTFTAVA